MITCRVEAIRQAAKDGAIVVANLRYFTVHQVRCAYHFAAKCLPDCLMSKTNTKDRNLASKLPYQFKGDACGIRGSRSRRDHDLCGLQITYLFNRDFIIPINLNLYTHLTQILHQVVGERIVVVYD